MAKLPVEIRCYDDGSSPVIRRRNAEIASWPRVVYRELSHNHGRARIRNLLADDARYDYLLFLDSDSRVPSADFLDRYLQQLPGPAVIYGGRVYSPHPPADAQYWLHWQYGRQREAQSLRERQRQPYLAIMTNNLLIPKTIAQRHPFREQLLTYGHEDTLFGYQLQQAGIPVRHIAAALEHTGLENRETFLEKQRLAVHNLYALRRSGYPLPTRLARLHEQIRRWQLAPLLYRLLRALHPYLVKRLRDYPRPSLRWLDALKLWWLLEVEKAD